jgi:hypothetical protein
VGRIGEEIALLGHRPTCRPERAPGEPPSDDRGDEYPPGAGQPYPQAQRRGRALDAVEVVGDDRDLWSLADTPRGNDDVAVALSDLRRGFALGEGILRQRTQRRLQARVADGDAITGDTVDDPRVGLVFR